MSQSVRCGLIQMAQPSLPPSASVRDRGHAMLEKHLPMIEEAGAKGVQILCLQELFNGPYFCSEQRDDWFDLAEGIPDGPTTQGMQALARTYGMVIVAPIFECVQSGEFYNSAAVIDADGRYMGTYRKHHIPFVSPGGHEKYYFRPGNLGFPVFRTRYADIGVYICYDRHFPEGARALGLNGAQIVFNPSATVLGLSDHLWELEQRGHAVANGYFVGAINRVGKEAFGEFYGKSYFCDPAGKIVAQADSEDALLVADLDLSQIEATRRRWQFYRDRRPDAYGALTAP